MMAPYKKGNNRYQKALTLKTKPFPCPECGLSLPPRKYEKHVTNQHDFNALFGCVWCRQVVWPKGHKQRHSDHLLTCLLHFLARLAFAAVQPYTCPVPPRLLDMTPLYPAEDAFGIVYQLPERAHEHPRLLDVRSYARLYDDDSLHLASCYVRHYLRTRLTTDWFHVMVKANAYESFLDAMRDDPHSQALAFSCWCNGGPLDVPEYRQHRHLIVLAPKGHFKAAVWDHVAPRVQPFRGYKCKLLRPLESAMHLVNTLAYLTRRRSQCEFSFESPLSKAPFRDNHFFLYQSLPRDRLLPLVLWWRGGLESLIAQAFRNTSGRQIAERPVRLVDGQWRQTLKDYHALQRGLVLPVRRDLVPTATAAEDAICLYLLDDQILCFDRDPEPPALTDEAWLRRQATLGNCFYDAVQEWDWTPGPARQEDLTNIVPLKDRIQQLESEMAGIRAEMAENEAALRNEIAVRSDEVSRLGDRCARLERDDRSAHMEDQYADLRERYARMEREHDALRERYARMAEENGDLRDRNARMEEESAELRDRYARMEEDYGELRDRYARMAQDYAELKERWARVENAERQDP